jgi:BirA family biotin operon repressor/biotin-[acetyl-CoA-carboxylase] ligase
LLIFTDTQTKLLTLLADGHFHSGTALASTLNISRSAIWKQLEGLAAYGVEIIAVSGKGYKLSRALELLSEARIKAELTLSAAELLSTLEIYSQIDSTNRYLVEAAQHDADSGQVCFAEAQTAGKGRRGRQWLSPFGSNIYCSILWRFQNDPASIAGLSLAVGVAVIRALHELGLSEIGLKWPNDIYWKNKKLGGILIEVSGESGGSCSAVIGLGLNLYLPVKETASITQPWTDLEQIMTASPLKDWPSCPATYSRNHIASLLLNHLLPVIAHFENDTLNHYLQEWRSCDVMLNKAVSIYIGNQQIDGRVVGIDDNGMLLLENAAGEIKTFASGEVSFRKSL